LVNPRLDEILSNSKILFILMGYKATPWHGKCTLLLPWTQKARGWTVAMRQRIAHRVPDIYFKGGFF
jgi:hypothetical protein